MMDSAELENYLIELKNDFNLSYTLKREQKEIILTVLNGKSCFGILPTGFGKSMCYTIPVILMDKIGKHGVCLVVSPLNSLINDQCETLRRYGISTSVLLKSLTDDLTSELINGSVKVLFSSPENLKTPSFRKLALRLKVSLFVCDEAHCISEWGEDFRPEFKDLESLRSVFSDTPVLVLTATANQKIVDDIFESLLLPSDIKVVAIAPDRPNIYLDVVKAKQDVKELAWLVEMVKRDKKCNKTIIYCRSYNASFDVWSFLVESLGEEAYDGPKLVENRVVEMYTSSTDVKSQERILSQFKKEDSKIRLLVSTIAFGMGISIPDIVIVINWGAPKTIMSFWQEVGRCGRDGRQGISITYPYSRSLASTVTDKEMIELFKNNNSCLRNGILRNFHVRGVNEIEGLTKQVCTLSCVSRCECQFCLCCFYCRSQCDCPVKHDINSLVV